MIKVFGLKELSRKVNELLLKEVKHKNEPEKWKWTPYNPEKIRNLKHIIDNEKEEVNYTCMTNYLASDKTQKVVLLFAMGNLTYGLIKHLEREKIKYFFLDYTQFVLQGEISVEINNENEIKMLKIGELILNLDDISVVIWNEPKYIKPLFDFNIIPARKERNRYLFIKRWVQFLRDLPLLVPKETIWIPGKPLNGSQEWQNKIGEYNLARSLGFNTPPTILTNDEGQLKAFFKSHGTQYLLREFCSPPYSFPPIKVEVTKLSLKYLKSSPCCFQKYIDKLYELRIVVLFERIYACKIHSQDSELTKRDWRVYDDENVKWELVEIPPEMKLKLVVMLKELEITWGSFDFIYGVDHRYHFMEVNRPGAHYWLEPFLGLDITREIVKEIIDKGCVEFDL